MRRFRSESVSLIATTVPAQKEATMSHLRAKLRIRLGSMLLATAVAMPVMLITPSHAATPLRGACSGRATLTWKTLGDGGTRFTLADGTATCTGVRVIRSTNVFPFFSISIWGVSMTFSGESEVDQTYVCGQGSPQPFEMDVTLRTGSRIAPFIVPPIGPGRTSVQQWFFAPVFVPFPPRLQILIHTPSEGDIGRGELISRTGLACPPSGNPAATLTWVWERPAVFN